jgi:hypothetical protein
MRRLVRVARVLAVAWVLLTLSLTGLLDAIGDCQAEGAQPDPTARLCFHGDAGRHERGTGSCPKDHHAAARCGCSCHHAIIVASVSRASLADLIGLLHSLPLQRLPERREAPALRPPIAG